MIHTVKLDILFFLGLISIAFQCEAAPNIDASFSLHAGYITVIINNTTTEDILISGFMEGINEAKIYKKSSSLPVVMNERVTQFDVTNKNVLWLHLRAVDTKYPGFGSSYRYRQKIESDKFLKFLESNEHDELYIEIVCRYAPVQNGKISKFEIIKLRITSQVPVKLKGNPDLERDHR